MSTATLEHIKAVTYHALGDTSLAHEAVRRRRPSARTAALVLRVAASVQRMVAYVTPARFDSSVLGLEGIQFIAALFQQVHDDLQALVKQARESGHVRQTWYPALVDALAEVDDTLEALYLSSDPEMRAAIEAAVAELDTARASAPEASPPADWKASLARLSD